MGAGEGEFEMSDILPVSWWCDAGVAGYSCRYAIGNGKESWWWCVAVGN
jgi:hypothetical protein